MSEECSYVSIMKLATTVEKCQFVKKVCDGNYFNPYQLHYCDFNGNLLYTIPLYLIILSLCFYLLSDTASKYLSNALTILTDKLKLSPNIAAMTFLSFGNGAPDVFSSIAASSNSTGDLSMSVGALIGSGICVSCFVFSLVIIFNKLSKSIKVKEKTYIREIVCYLVAILALGLMGVDGVIKLYEAILFFLLYFVNLGFAIYIEKDYEAERTKSKPTEDYFKDDNNINSTDSNLQDKLLEFRNSEEEHHTNENYEEVAEHVVSVIRNIEKKKKIESKFKVDKVEKVDNLERGSTYDKIDRAISFKNLDNKEELALELKQTYDQVKEVENKEDLFFRIKRNYFTNVYDWDEMGFFSKAFCVCIQIPLNFLRDISIPCCDNKEYIKIILVLNPLFSAVAVISLLLAWGKVINSIAILVAILVSILVLMGIFFFGFKDNYLPENKITIILLCLYRFSMSIFWIWAISTTLIDILQFLGVIFDLPMSFLGLTLLAIGNSAPDASLDVNLARKGFGEMALAGTISGPLFNLLIGLGLSLIKMTVKKDVIFNIWDAKNIANCLSMGFLFVNLSFILLFGFYSQFNYSRVASYISLFLFISYITSVSIVTFI